MTEPMKPVAHTEETSVGAKMFIYGVEVAWPLNCGFGTYWDPLKEKLAYQINAAAADQLREAQLEAIKAALEAARIEIMQFEDCWQFSEAVEAIDPEIILKGLV